MERIDYLTRITDLMEIQAAMLPIAAQTISRAERILSQAAALAGSGTMLTTRQTKTAQYPNLFTYGK